ncbi:MAG: hypothetical protein ACLQHS_16860 [Candidatus Limnocylindrales bacterium]
MNLNSILIGSADPQRLTDYYTKLFGAPGWNEGGFSGWQIDSDSSSQSGRMIRSRAPTCSRDG